MATTLNSESILSALLSRGNVSTGENILIAANRSNEQEPSHERFSKLLASLNTLGYGGMAENNCNQGNTNSATNLDTKRFEQRMQYQTDKLPSTLAGFGSLHNLYRTGGQEPLSIDTFAPILQKRRASSLCTTTSVSSADSLDYQPSSKKRSVETGPSEISSGATLSTRKRCMDCKTCNHKPCGVCNNCLHKKKRKRSCENRLPCLSELAQFTKQVFDTSNAEKILRALSELSNHSSDSLLSVQEQIEIIEKRQQHLKDQRKSLAAEDKALELLKRTFRKA